MTNTNTETNNSPLSAPPALVWNETKPGRWIGQAPKGGNYLIEEDNGFFTIARLTLAPVGARDIGGCTDLPSAQRLATDHFNNV